MESSDHDLLREIFRKNDAPGLRDFLAQRPELRKRINDPIGPFDSPLICSVRTREMLDAALEAGADINARSRWWAGGFGLLDQAEPPLAHYAIARGATLDVHSAARLGLIEKLRQFVAADPELVHARGGDGQTPLHFARDVATAAYLLDHGAEIDARDIDHESTPAQYMIADRQEIVRFLIDRGCKVDIFMAAAVGNFELARKLVEAQPDCVRFRVSEEFFPKKNPRSGGTIYIWTLGQNISPHEVARKFGHQEVYEYLLSRSPASVKLLHACLAGDEPAVTALVRSEPGLVQSLSNEERRQIAHAARDNNTAAVRLMLGAGFPVNVGGQHGAPALYWAAWHGNAEMVRDILARKPLLEVNGLDFPGTALDWAIHGSQNSWYREKGNHPETVNLLLAAGAVTPKKIGGTPEVQEILKAP